jgi:predicted PurR-regulated permease PerM
MKRKGDKILKKMYRKIIIRFIIIALIVLLILILWKYISDLSKYIDILVKHNHQQSVEINSLQDHVSQLEAQNSLLHNENTGLHNIVVEQQEHIKGLLHTPKVEYITNTETSSIKVKFHHEPSAPVVEQEKPQIVTPTLVVGVLVTLGSALKMLVPSF